jgi:phenylalanyl-tRNA synthetase beta chain
MGHTAVKVDEETYKVRVAPLRADVLHACDISEDVGVAFGFNNIP